jgi:uncharacterized protein
VAGAANAALVALLARSLDHPRRLITIIAGETSRSKRVKVVGLTVAQVRERLELPDGC